MNFQKSTRYALYAAMEMARSNPGTTVTVAEVADRYGVPGSVLAKVFQQLVRGEIAVGTRGQRGGYRLTRPASELTMLDVIDTFESRPSPGECAALDQVEECCRVGSCRLQRVFDEVDEVARCTYASISLETLATKPGTGAGGASGG